jgi:glucosamine--fructose-6-phosphate aminotransferase (isomerizing)
MCGIIGCLLRGGDIGSIVHDALKRLEYRGYDSVGEASIFDGKLYVKKDHGKIDDVHNRLNLNDLPGRVAIGHVRWATHGRPSRVNAHPHVDCRAKIAVVHNGIIENFSKIKSELLQKGHIFSSETDTEIVPHLIEEFMKKGLNFADAFRESIKKLEGSYAIAAICSDDGDKIVCARNDAPLILGIGEKALFCASDIPAFLPFTNRAVIIQDGEMVILSDGGFEIRKVDSWELVKRGVTTIDWTLEMAEKQGFSHFMLKEIFEQPQAIKNTLRVSQEELDALLKLFLNAKRVYLVACGTAYHAALIGKYALAKLAGVPVEVVISSEFQESCIADSDTVVLAISQSGETADTLRAVRVAREFGAKIACLTNVVASSITRESEIVCYTRAGPEIGVAATKTFAAQVAYLLKFAIHLANAQKKISNDEYEKLLNQLSFISDAVKEAIRKNDPVMKRLAKNYKNSQNFYFIGRGIGYPVSMEGALKLKEIAYVHSEAYPAGELKHGPLALIEEGSPVVAVVSPEGARTRMLGNIEEVRARGASVMAVGFDDDEELEMRVNEFITVPVTHELLSPLVLITPLQLLAYYMGVERKHDPDKPRSLAKSVTVL